MGAHPKNIIFLTCDAFGVLPPVSRLTPSQATYHFLSGYTAKVAGTEVGIAEPQATFSACFGAAFLVLHPTRYGEFLADKIREHQTASLAGQHGLDRRTVRRRLADQAVVYQRDHRRDSRRLAAPGADDRRRALAAFHPHLVPRRPGRAVEPPHGLAKPRSLRASRRQARHAISGKFRKTRSFVFVVGLG